LTIIIVHLVHVNQSDLPPFHQLIPVYSGCYTMDTVCY